MATSALHTSGASHRWRFSRIGGLDLVRIETAGDLINLEQLDQKLWTALACPVKGLEFDEKTLALIDADNDGRVRAPEVIAAVRWVCAALHDPAVLIKGGDSLPLSAIKDAELLASAREVLTSLGRSDADVISLADVSDTARIFAATRLNGDGVITAESTNGDVELTTIINEIIATQGGAADRSGKTGVDATKVSAFFAALSGFEAWTKQGDASRAEILPLGDATAGAAHAFDTVRAKIDDYFARCRLAAFDSRATTALNRQESEFLELASLDLSVTPEEISGFPLARVDPQGVLPLSAGVNPAWTAAMDAFRTAVVEPLLGAKATLTEAEWSGIKAKLAAYHAWKAAETGASVASLGIGRVRQLLSSEARAKLESLIAEDLEFAPRFTAIATVEKLIRLQRDLYRLLQNFVTFTDFYSPDRLAIFQAGTLYLDSRSCELVVQVGDPARHAALAGLSRACLAYCDCARPASGEKMQIAVAFTNGDADHLMVGRNGVFYDRKGRDWDATITKLIDNPMSIRQAFWSPYKKLVRMFEEQAAKRAAAAETSTDAKLSSTAIAAVNVDATGKPPQPKKFDVGTVAALGVAVSGIVAVLTAIIGGILGLSWWQIPLAVLGVLLFISGPSMIIAALKLRQRSLGPILDANGWAVNGRVRINIPFGTSLTEVAKLPPGSQRSLDDPFAEKKTPWKLYLFLLLLAVFAVWTRWDHNTHEGLYFWQRPPIVEEPAAPEPAPAEPAPAESVPTG